jgi:hypothetical protein
MLAGRSAAISATAIATTRPTATVVPIVEANPIAADESAANAAHCIDEPLGRGFQAIGMLMKPRPGPRDVENPCYE